jgi:hypothetical protein
VIVRRYEALTGDAAILVETVERFADPETRRSSRRAGATTEQVDPERQGGRARWGRANVSGRGYSQPAIVILRRLRPFWKPDGELLRAYSSWQING